LTRVSFGLYWIFDNISVLSTIKFFKFDAKFHIKYGGVFWFTALLLSIVQDFRTLLMNFKQEIDAKQKGIENDNSLLL